MPKLHAIKGKDYLFKVSFNDRITFTRKFQYLLQIKNSEISSPWNFQLFFLTKCLIKDIKDIKDFILELMKLNVFVVQCTYLYLTIFAAQALKAS